MTLFREHRLIHQNVRYNSRTAKANAAQQQQVHQQAIQNSQQNAQRVTVPGGLQKSQYSTSETERFVTPDNKEVFLPKGSNPTVPGGTRLPDGTTTPQPTQQQNPATPAGPTVAPKRLTGNDLLMAAQQRRDERLQKLGLTPDNEIRQLLDNGAKYTGDWENGQAVFVTKDGRRVVAGISGEQADRDVKAYQSSDVASVQAEIEAEQNSMIQQEQGQLRSDAAAGKDQGKQEKQGTQKAPSADSVQVSEAKNEWQSIMEQAKGLSPEILAAYTPGIEKRLNRVAELEREISSVEAEDVTKDPLVVTATERANRQEAKLDARLADSKRRAEEIKDLKIEAAEYARDMLEIDKQIIEAKNKESEQRQIALNVQNERRLRREMNAAGLETSPLGLDYLESKVQQGADTLASLRQTNNLTVLKANLAIGQGYVLDVNNALNEYEGQIASLEAQHDDLVDANDDSVLQAVGEAKKDKATRLKELEKKREELDIAAGDKIAEAINKAVDLKMQNDRLESQERNANKRLEYQERMANQRLERQLTEDEKRQTRAEIADERKGEKNVRDTFSKVNNLPTVKDYRTIRDNANKAANVLTQALKSGRLDKSVAKETLTVLYEKTLDPSSVVREGEYDRAGLAQSVYQKAELALKVLAGGDLTGLDQDTINAFQRTIDAMTESQRSAAAGEYAIAINALADFNAGSNHINIDPRTIVPPDFLDEYVMQDYLENEQPDSYKFDWGSASGQGSTPEEPAPETVSALQKAIPKTGISMADTYKTYSMARQEPTQEALLVQSFTGSAGDLLASIAPITQDFDTPIDESHYKPETVKAWGGAHKGLDVAMRSGELMPSLTSGTVKSVTYDEGYGLSVIVEAEDGAEIRYSHLSTVDPYLKVGSTVGKGQPFGQIGKTGNVFGRTGVHLDLRIRKDGEYIDPFTYMV